MRIPDSEPKSDAERQGDQEAKDGKEEDGDAITAVEKEELSNDVR